MSKTYIESIAYRVAASRDGSAATGSSAARGPKGDKGDKGEKGDTGSKGAAGESAYQTAVRVGGFTGTEAEWLESLQGEDGVPAGIGSVAAEAETLEAGSAATAEATVSGPRTSRTFTFSFGIPKGEKGEKGDPGSATAEVPVEDLLQAPPTLTTNRGYSHDGVAGSVLYVAHPLLGADGCEAVLMVYRKGNASKTCSDETGKQLRTSKKGWAVACGDHKITGGAALTGSSADDGQKFSYTSLRDFIVRRFMAYEGYTAAELFARDYSQWNAESSSSRGFGKSWAVRMRFGIAVRYANPGFTALVDTSKTLAETTQWLKGSAGGKVWRYLYSSVAPLDVMLSTSAAGNLRSEIWFGLAGR